MNWRHLKIALRLVGLILIVCAAVVFFSDTSSFRCETEAFREAYQIHHTVVLSQRAIILSVVGVTLCVSSLFIRSKRV